MSAGALAWVDHVVLACPDLERGVDEVERRLGVRATPGGRHPAWGTRNALLALGPRSYLELVGPDPDGGGATGPRPFGLGTLDAPRLVTWAAPSAELDRLAALALGGGDGLGAVLEGERQRPDGTTLRWRLTDPVTVVADGVVPFFIDWGRSPHPAATAAPGAQLVELRAVHPDAERVRAALALLELDLPVAAGPEPALVATVACPRGRVELR